ncbi:endopeptidase La, partial [Pseudomonas savastanoi pv. glycinea]
ALYIESILTHAISSGSGHAGMHVTGHLKDVMKESASIAYSFAKLFLVKEYPENRFFEAADIHIHCPDGAIPKDGPSAGISFTSSLISLALNKALPPTIAMTGEITLTGKVLPVGGLREKILGAKRYGCDTIIFPKDIENELEEIPKEVK